MLLFLFVVVFIVSFLVLRYSEDSDAYLPDSIIYPLVIIVVSSGVSLVVALLVLFINISSSPTYKIELDQQKEAIEHKIESGAWKDELGLLDKTVIDEITDYNSAVEYRQYYANDFWFGIFWSDIFDDMETIDYNILYDD